MNDDLTDLTAAAEPKSDQINAEDFLSGPRTVTVARVTTGPGNGQAVEIKLRECKPFRPCKTMIRVLIAAWGKDPRQWAPDSRMTLYRDPAAKFGGMEVGGIRISHLSGLTEPLELALSESKGKRRRFIVHPLAGGARPTYDLEGVLFNAGLTVADVDLWLAANGKDASGAGTDEERAKLAGWLAAKPERFDAIRAAVAEHVQGGRE
ncbi:MAG: hypothetical protein NUW01_07460 [Gemmatimonadaceae bacterium]|nr:hypothetical protein [Gemmatimonadaceae bacterium]